MLDEYFKQGCVYMKKQFAIGVSAMAILLTGCTNNGTDLKDTPIKPNNQEEVTVNKPDSLVENLPIDKDVFFENYEHVKQISDTFFQTVEIDETSSSNGGSYTFKTWEYKENQTKPTLIFEKVYSDDSMIYGLEIGASVFADWESIEGYHEPYPDTTLTKDFLTYAKEGKFPNSKLTIGMSTAEALTIQPNPLKKFYYEGGEFHQYNDYSFMTNPDVDKVVVLAIHGDKISIDTDEMIAILGEPTDSYFNEMEGGFVHEYITGERTLMFYSDAETGPIIGLWLR